MRSFPACHGNNCFIELMKSWFQYQCDRQISEVALFIAMSRLDFQYQMKKNHGEIIPSINVVQKYDRLGLQSLGVCIEEHESDTWEQEWESIKQFISQGEVPIVTIAGSGIPGVTNSLPPTFLAVHGIDEGQGVVDVTCVYYQGSLKIEEFKKLRAQLNDYGTASNVWLAYTLPGQPEFGNEFVWKRTLSEQVVGKQLSQQVEQGLQQFANDLQSVLSLPSLYFKIFIKGLHKQIWHPWGLPSVRKQLLQVVRDIHSSETLVEAFSLVDREWGIVQRLFGKAIVGDEKSIMERVVDRLHKLAAIEAKAFLLLEQELGGIVG